MGTMSPAVPIQFPLTTLRQMRGQNSKFTIKLMTKVCFTNSTTMQTVDNFYSQIVSNVTNETILSLSTQKQNIRKMIPKGNEVLLTKNELNNLQYYDFQITRIGLLDRDKPIFGKIVVKIAIMIVSMMRKRKPKVQFVNSLQMPLQQLFKALTAIIVYVQNMQIQQMNPESISRPLKIKTCLTSFQRYCDEHERSQEQMSKLKKYFETTITRYRKKPLHSQSESQYKVQVNRSVNSMAHRIKNHSGMNQQLMKRGVDPEIIEITKAKLHDNGRYEKLKTQYTVPRKNIKTYVKMKKTSDFTALKTGCQSSNFQQQQRYSTYDREYPRYRQVTNSTEMGQIIIQLKKKDNKQTMKGRDSVTMDKRTIKSHKVVYSSKGNTSFNRYQKQEKYIKSSNQTSRNKDIVLTGWEIKDYDDCFGVQQTQHLKKARQKTII